MYVEERDTYELASHHHARNPYTPSSSFQALGYCSSSESGSRTVQDQPLFRPQAPTLRTLTTLRATTKGGGIENGALKTLFRGGRKREGIEGGEEERDVGRVEERGRQVELKSNVGRTVALARVASQPRHGIAPRVAPWIQTPVPSTRTSLRTN